MLDYGKEVEALRSIEAAVKEKSIKLLKENIEKNKEYFKDPIINYHINNLQNDLLEKNLIKIIKPYSVVEIDFVAKSIGLEYQDVLNKLRQMILDKKINGILDQGKGSLIIYELEASNPYLGKSIETFKNLEKVVSVRLWARAMIWSWHTMMAPMGISPSSKAFCASSSALRMYFSSFCCCSMFAKLLNNS